MAQIPTTPARSKMPTLGGGAKIGGFVDANDMGAGNAEQMGRLGQAVQGAGQAAMRHGQEAYERDARAANNNAYVDYMKRMGEEKNRLYTLKGRDAKILPDEIKKAQRVAGEMAMKGLDTPRARELFEQSRLQFDMHDQLAADRYAIEQNKAGYDSSEEAKRGEYLDQITVNPDDSIMFIGNIQYSMASIEQQYRGAPPEAINRKQQEYVALAVKARVKGIVDKNGPQAALDFLATDIADMVMGDADNGLIKSEIIDIRKGLSGQAQEAAKKDSSNQARELGIRLGEQYNSDIEIERALYGFDKEIADIARTEANRIMKARLSAGEATLADDRQAIVRDIADAAKDEKEMYDLVDAIPDMTAKERKELIAEITPRLKANQSRKEEADKEVEAAEKEAKTQADAQAKEQNAEFVRTEAALIAKGARDEAEINTMVDYMENVTEAQRESIRTTAVSRLKVKNTRIAAEKAQTEAQAMQTMEKAGWDVAAISPDWSSELQDKMRELAGKNRKADPLKALEYCDMTREQLQKAVQNGEWPEIAMHVKGISTEMYNQLAKKAFGDEASLKGTRNVMQVGRDEFIFQTQINPSTREGQLSYANFIRQYEPMLIEKARSLGLDDLNKIPEEEVNEVLKSLLEKGEYDEGIWYWGRERYRFQVASDPKMDMRYFSPNQPLNPSGTITAGGDTVSSNAALPSITASSGGTPIKRDRVPSHAQQFIGEGAEDIRLLDDNTVTYINRDGNMIIKEPGKPPLIAESLNPQRKTRQAADMLDDAWKELFDVVDYGSIR